MIYMIKGCSSLEYLNFENVEMNISCNYSNIFNGASENLIICSKYETWKEILMDVYLLILVVLIFITRSKVMI